MKPSGGSPGGSRGATPIGLMGSGAFAIPSFEAIAARAEGLGVSIALVVSQPDRPAGRGRGVQATPVSAWAKGRGLELLARDDVNDGVIRELLVASGVAHVVVIAFGQRLSEGLLSGVDAINLHGSLLPRWRGAAPIQRSLMEGDRRVGVSVIEVSPRMDAGLVYAQAVTEVGDRETAGELHDRLALVGVEPLVETLGRLVGGGRSSLGGIVQDEPIATRARKLSRADAYVDFSATAVRVAARINGLSPWPGVDAMLGDHPIKILRACAVEMDTTDSPPGTVLAEGGVACGAGAVELLEVQVPGGRACSLRAFLLGRRLGVGCLVRSAPPS